MEGDNTLKNGRRVDFDLLKIIACFCVLVDHTSYKTFLNADINTFTWFASASYFYSSKFAVPVFLMVSGALLLRKNDDYLTVYKRIGRVLLALIIFSYFHYASWFSWSTIFDFKEFLWRLCTFGNTYSYWYLYMYIGILIMYPMLQRMVSNFSKKDFLYFGFWAYLFLGIYPLITHFYPELIYKTTTVGYAPLIGPFNNNYAYSMFIILPIFHVYIAYFITGYFIDNFVDYNKKLLVVAIAVAILSVGLSVYLTYAENIRLDKSVGKYVFFMYNNLFLITCSSLSICVFYIGKCIPHIINFSYCQRKVISYFGMLSFGIYLLGDKFIYWYRDVHQVLLSYTSPLIGLVLYQLIVFLTCMAITMVLIKLPIFRKIL